ncbi:hypothetical protein [Paenibacillus polymyxa]|uniref:Uncharacterized protein n=1 Tax=Paenibacillus polymyxa (strain SC2) TaxID=886882 RepID=A0A0D5ZCP9_PAEPS|nr:hypothetical protein [Paenibacillus polymyxa]AKA44344.1 hypothetical protein PPSC2_26105 [Paenibacillus polymyxa SC2]WPQ59953.1 hypothetical protein SKN87_27305 [Paenibacillus polymyxa]
MIGEVLRQNKKFYVECEGGNMNTIVEFLHEKERILHSNDIGMHRKITSLQFLLSEIASKFSIPLLYGEEYKAKHQEMITVFESIFEAIKELQTV